MEKCERCGIKHRFGRQFCEKAAMAAFRQGWHSGFQDARKQYGKIADSVPGLREAAKKLNKPKEKKSA